MHQDTEKEVGFFFFFGFVSFVYSNLDSGLG